MKKITAAIIVLLTSLSGFADVDFETNAGYKSIGIYDCWEDSPFRNGKLDANVAVVNNPDKSINAQLGYAPNSSEKVLAAQRSRYGSNLFGVEIVLNEPIRLSTSPQYVHALIKRPVNGRVALVGLGKRDDRGDQSGREEQIWVIANQDVKPNRWEDAVFEVKGSPDVLLYSLVIVPECESPHKLKEDYLFYVDDIIINNDKVPRHSAESYSINFSKEFASINHATRYTEGVGLHTDRCGNQYVEVDQKNSRKLYFENKNSAFLTLSGDKICPYIKHVEDWMHTYLYIDFNNDGKFNPESELVSYSCFINKDGSAVNSSGDVLNGTNVDSMPCFTIPDSVASGLYRMRYVLDWNCKDPGGNSDNNNLIINNGGSITDVMLAVEKNKRVTVSANQLNGDIADSNGQLLDGVKVEAGKPFEIKMLPAPGFTYSGVRIRSGYNHESSTDKNGNPGYFDKVIQKEQFSNDDKFVIPGDLIYGSVFIEGFFVEKK